jgi:hypothetical protein
MTETDDGVSVIATSSVASSEAYYTSGEYGGLTDLWGAVSVGDVLYAISEANGTYAVVQVDGDNCYELYQAPDGGYLLWLAGNETTLAFVTSTPGESGEQFTLSTIGTDGNGYTELLSDALSLDSIGGMAMDNDGNIYFLTGSGVQVTDTSGTEISTFSSAGVASNLFRTPDGIVCVSSAKDNVTYVEKLVPASDTAKTTWAFEGGQWQAYGGFGNNLFLLDNGELLLGFDGQSITELINWNASSIHPTALLSVWKNSLGILCYFDQNRLYQLTPVDASQVPETTSISIGVWDLSNVESAIGYYQQQHPEVTVEFQRYSLSDGMTDLNLELAAGDAPDLFDLAGLNDTSYANKGALLDLTPQLNADGLSTDDFISADILKTGDSLYVIPSGFSIETWKGLTSVFGNQIGWTWAEYMEMQESLANGQFMTPVTPENFLSNSLYSLLRDCIDYSAASCDFSPLEDVLAAASDCKFTGEFYDSDIADGTVRLMGANISSIGDYTSLVKDGAYTLIGLPSEDGNCTAYFSYDSLFGINASSANIDGAWDLIRYVVCDYPLENAVVLPCISAYRPIVEQEIARRLNPENQYEGASITGSDEDGYTIDSVYYEPGIISMTPTMTQAEADSFWNFVDGISLYYAYDSEISSIIQEESAAYFSGDKSAEDVISLIESRTSIYLSEQQ